ncbi:MAG TPA: CapA family protein [Phycisphaerae bacterium]|nr:CapA family protein [Phycisphaerae bacterium]
MNQVSVVMVGDVRFNRSLADDPVAAIGRLSAEFRRELEADVLLANLECSLGSPVPRVGAKNDVPLATCPPSSALALKALGVNVVTMANNHIFDGGAQGLDLTRKVLDEAGIAYFGAGLNYEEAAKPWIVERNGVRIGFLGFCGCECAGRNKPGTLLLDYGASYRLMRKVKDDCDYLVIYFHEGIEATNYPTRMAMRACHRAVDCGADLVVGTHPHTVQGIERYKGVPIVYSLGNFIMPLLDPLEYGWWQPQTALARMGIGFDRKLIARALILRCVFRRGERVRVEPVPILVEESGLPRLPAGDEVAEEAAFLEELCEAFHRPDSPVWRVRDEVERGYARLGRSDISWTYVLRNLHRTRPHHVVSFLRTFR